MKLIRVHTERQRLRKNRKGSIEGLPLHLMIIVMIATLGTAVIIGWMGDIETPSTIDDISVDPGYINLTGTNSTTGDYTITKATTFTVLDNNGNPVEGANVTLSGLGVEQSKTGTTVTGTTNADGKVSFSNIKIHLNSNIGTIKVIASKTGYGESTCDLKVIA